MMKKLFGAILSVIGITPLPSFGATDVAVLVDGPDSVSVPMQRCLLKNLSDDFPEARLTTSIDLSVRPSAIVHVMALDEDRNAITGYSQIMLIPSKDIFKDGLRNKNSARNRLVFIDPESQFMIRRDSIASVCEGLYSLIFIRMIYWSSIGL